MHCVQLLVQSLSGATRVMNRSADTTVEMLASELADSDRLPAHCFDLRVYRRGILVQLHSRSCTLKQLEIKKDERVVMHLVSPLKGGMEPDISPGALAFLSHRLSTER